MPDVQLFHFRGDHATELEGSHALLEKHLQSKVEKNMETLFGVRFLASEYRTGDRHGGRIDSLGIDDNGSPVIFEYKRTRSESVIIQGLFYLDWLMDHRAEFTQLVAERGHHDLAGAIDWNTPRLICVATDFTRYDIHAVQQIHRAIDLVTYRDFGGDLLSLELLQAANSLTVRRSSPGTPAPYKTPLPKAPSTPDSDAAQVDDATGDDDEVLEPGAPAAPRAAGSPALQEKLKKSSPALRELFDEVVDYCMSLGDDVVEVPRHHSLAYRKLKNFAEVKVHHQIEDVTVNLRVDPRTVELREGFTRDMRNGDRGGRLDLQVRITGRGQLDAAFALIEQAYRNV